MRRLLLDTHTFLWWLMDLPKLGERAKNMIMDSKYSYLEFDFGTGINYSINQVANMFGRDYPKEYVKSRDGEYNFSLADNTYTKNTLNWKPRRKLSNYIKNIVNP